MSYRRTGWKSETENTSKSTTLENQTSTSSFDYSIIPSTILNIGLIILGCVFFTTCRVDDKVIKQCQELLGDYTTWKRQLFIHVCVRLSLLAFYHLLLTLGFYQGNNVCLQLCVML